MKRLGFAAAFGLACMGLALLGGCHGGGGAISTTIEIIPPVTGESIDVGTTAPLNFTATLGDDVTNAGVSWELTGSDCSGNGCGTLVNQQRFSVSYVPPTAIPSTTAALTVTLTATSIAQHGTTQTTTINVEPLPTFTTSACNPPIPTGTTATCGLAGASNGQAYSEPIQITGGVEPYTFSVTSTTINNVAGSLSAECLSLTVTQTTSTSTTVAGKPCNTGSTPTSTTFTVQVADSGGAAPIAQRFSTIIAPAPPLSIITTSLAAGNLHAQYSQTVAVNGGVTPLTWAITGTLPPGLTLNSTNGQITGIPTAAGTYPFTVAVTDSALPTNQHASQAYTITVKTPGLLSISPTTNTALPAGITATGYTTSIQATGGVTPYTWTLTQGQLPPGLALSVSQGGNAVISGTPSVIGTYQFTVQVADAEVTPNTQTQTGTYTITISGGQNNNSLLQGSYSFIFRGFDKDGAMAMIGTLTSDGNGNLTGSEAINRISGVAPAATVTGVYEIDSNTTGSANGTPGDGRGVMELTTAIGQQIFTSVYELALESDGSVQFIQEHNYPTTPPFSTTNTGPEQPDAFATHGAGVMKPVVGTGSQSNFSGNYAFEFTGVDANKKPDALAGAFHADGSGTSGTVTSGACDFNDAGTYSSQSISGEFTFPASTVGSAEFTFELPKSGQQTLQFEYIFVSPSDLYFIETDANTTTSPGTPTLDRLSGEAVLQQPNITFNANSLSGAEVVSTTGVDSGGNATVTAGLFTAGSATACDGQTGNTFAFDQNDNGTLTSPSATETCTVNPMTGRVAFTSQTPSVAVPFAAAYLVGPGEGFLIGNDATVPAGLMELQTAPAPLGAASISGAYAIGAPFIAEAGGNNLSGVVTADGAGDVSGSVDEADAGGATQMLNQPFAATIAAVGANGRGTMSTTTAATGFPTNWILYIVSPTAIRAIPADAGKQHPQIILLGPTTF